MPPPTPRPIAEDPFALDRAQRRGAFERAAATYDSVARLQRQVGRELIERLDLLRAFVPTAVLDAGCGTGFCTRLLARRYRRAAVVIGLDLAEAMVRHARRQSAWWRRLFGGEAPIAYAAGDIERLPLASGSIDLIVSNLALQWCDPRSALAEFRRVLAPGGLLLFTSFGPDTLKELRAAWRTVDDAPHVHTFLDMHDLGDMLLAAGFTDPVMDVERLTEYYPDVPALLRELKALGAHNIAAGRARGLTGKRHFARFRAAYEAMAQGGRIPASFEVVFGHAWAPAFEGDESRGAGSGEWKPIAFHPRP
jgi:malonyl-CoA O-methyltransferase